MVDFGMLMKSLLIQLPSLIAYVVGIVLATVFWRRCPRACLLALVGCAVLAANSLLGGVVSVWLFNISRAREGWGVNLMTVGDIGMVISIVRSLVYLVGFALVLAAVFSGRPRAEEPGT